MASDIFPQKNTWGTSYKFQFFFFSTPMKWLEFSAIVLCSKHGVNLNFSYLKHYFYHLFISRGDDGYLHQWSVYSREGGCLIEGGNMVYHLQYNRNNIYT